MADRLKDRVALVTGAASGIGHATAELFAYEGACVLAVDLPGVPCAFSTDRIIAIESDVAADDAPGRIAQVLDAGFGRVDIVVNNAAILRSAPFAEMSDEFWDTMFHVSLRAGFRIVRDLLPLLKRSAAGRIISMSSMAAQRAVPQQSAYGAAKAGLIALARNMALEFGPHGITSNVILPGPVMTGMTHAMDPARAAAWSARSPLGRLGEPEDVATVALFFASDDAAYVTGQALAVDGGIFIGA
ncbi:MAG TPA: SDR family oxidoreductase [Sphingomonas sp.]|jgi:NAD(P)-dependent dehydrogenase (short-subunit alcohol dehydrogenase family)